MGALWDLEGALFSFGSLFPDNFAYQKGRAWLGASEGLRVQAAAAFPCLCGSRGLVWCKLEKFLNWTSQRRISIGLALRIGFKSMECTDIHPLALK